MTMSGEQLAEARRILRGWMGPVETWVEPGGVIGMGRRPIPVDKLSDEEIERIVREINYETLEFPDR